MDTKKIKKMFSEIADFYGFCYQFGYWYIESAECIFTLKLQKSNFGNFYYLNVEVYVNGVFNKKIIKNKDLIKDFGHASIRPPEKFLSFLDCDQNMENEKRRVGLEALFDQYIMPLVKEALSMKGLLKLGEERKIRIEPVIKKEIEKVLS